jgi:hypothetical protein
MALTATDLVDIRSIFREELKEEIEPIRGDLIAMSNDIKEIYSMIATLQNSSITDSRFRKMTLESKLLTLNAELLEAAKQAGINLPR